MPSPRAAEVTMVVPDHTKIESMLVTGFSMTQSFGDDAFDTVMRLPPGVHCGRIEIALSAPKGCSEALTLRVGTSLSISQESRSEGCVTNLSPNFGTGAWDIDVQLLPHVTKCRCVFVFEKSQR